MDTSQPCSQSPFPRPAQGHLESPVGKSSSLSSWGEGSSWTEHLAYLFFLEFRKQFCNCFNEMGKWPCDLMLLKKRNQAHSQPKNVVLTVSTVWNFLSPDDLLTSSSLVSLSLFSRRSFLTTLCSPDPPTLCYISFFVVVQTYYGLPW